MPYYLFTNKRQGFTVRGYGDDPIGALRCAAFTFGCEIEPPFDRIGNWKVENIGENPE